MTPSEITRLRALCEKATKAPWNVEAGGTMSGRTEYYAATWCTEDVDDAAFICAARTALPELLDEWSRVQDEYEASLDEQATIIEERDAARNEIAALRAAYRVLQEKHRPQCDVSAAALYWAQVDESPCTCGLHVRKAEARRKLEGE